MENAITTLASAANYKNVEAICFTVLGVVAIYGTVSIAGMLLGYESGIGIDPKSGNFGVWTKNSRFALAA